MKDSKNLNLPKIRVALQGLGSAGRARLQAIQNSLNFDLAGIISRRPEISSLSLEEAYQDDQIEAVVISTENTDHEKSIEAALRANKHVLCEYPIALSLKKAKSLLQLAREKNRILHVEHIALLSQDHLRFREEAKQRGAVRRGEYLFQGSWNTKIASSSWSGPLPILVLSRLVQIADWFGAFEIAEARKEISEEKFFLHLHLKFPSGGVLGFTEERRSGLPRKRSLVAECEKGSLVWKSGVASEGLFAQDLDWFYHRVREGKANYYSEDLMLDVLRELEKTFAS